MIKLTRIKKREVLNTVYAMDNKSNGGANHLYEIVTNNQTKNTVGIIQFQNGARKLEDSVSGVTNEDLLEIVLHRLQCFQTGCLTNRESEVALTHVENALLWLNKRNEDRIERNVLGTMQK